MFGGMGAVGAERVLGTSNFGLLDVPFPAESIFVSQILWGSIGWATGEHSTPHCLIVPDDG